MPGIERLDLIKPLDRAMLVVYTETWATYTAAVVRIRVDGLTMTNPDSGHTSAHPCVQIANTAAGQLRAFAAEFGLSAVAERRLSVTTCQIPKPMVKLGSNSASSHSCAFAGFHRAARRDRAPRHRNRLGVPGLVAVEICHLDTSSYFDLSTPLLFSEVAIPPR